MTMKKIYKKPVSMVILLQSSTMLMAQSLTGQETSENPHVNLIEEEYNGEACVREDAYYGSFAWEDYDYDYEDEY